MFWDILRKDLKRKKTINIVILLFIILAAMFVASGLNNVLTVVNGTDYYLDQADIGDYVVLTQQGDGGVPELLDTCQYVKDYRMDHIMYATKENIKAEGKELDMANKAMIIESISESEIHFFTKDNKELTKVPEGEVYVTGNFLDANDLKEGDKLTITHGENSVELTIAGKAKDALLGSEFMGNKRFILNEADYQKFASDESLAEYRGEIIYIDTDNPSEIASLLSNASNILFNRGRDIFKLCYVMDMIVAFVVLVLSVCLMIVSFAVLKFTITFTVTEEYREIGVMKAIGITDFKIRSLYLVKYLMLAVVGAAIGFLASIPFGNMLLQSVTENMMLGNSHAITANFMGAVIVIAVTIWFAYRCTGKVKKLTPVDAIRNGQSGERFKKKSIYRLGKSRFNSTWYLAVNDILSSPRRFLTIILSFFLCSVFMLGVVITTDTMKSKNLITTFGKESDVYISDVSQAMGNMAGKTRADLAKELDNLAEELTEEGMPSEMSVEIQYNYQVTFDGKEFNLTCQQGVNTKATDYAYTQGTIPQNGNEIAITKQISDLTGAKIGDVMTFDFDGNKQDCMVTAYYQTMNNVGEVVRLHEDAPTDFNSIASSMDYQVDFTDHPSDEVIRSRIEKIKKLWNNEEVRSAAEYCAEMVGVVDTMEAVQYLLLAITMIVVILVTVLMERSFIADEKSQIALLKAMGFTDGTVISWQVKRFGIVALIVELLAAILAKPVTTLWCSPIYGMMGASDIKFYVNVWKIYGMYPGIIFLTTLAAVFLTACYTRKISSSDSVGIE